MDYILIKAMHHERRAAAQQRQMGEVRRHRRSWRRRMHR